MASQTPIREQIDALEAELNALLDWATVPPPLRSALIRRLVALRAKLDAAERGAGPDEGDRGA